LPEPVDVVARDGCCDVLGRVAQIDGVDLGRWARTQQARGQREYAAAVCGCCLGEDADDVVGVGLGEVLERHELRFVGRVYLGCRERQTDGGEERDALDFARVWV